MWHSITQHARASIATLACTRGESVRVDASNARAASRAGRGVSMMRVEDMISLRVEAGRSVSMRAGGASSSPARLPRAIEGGSGHKRRLGREIIAGGGRQGAGVSGQKGKQHEAGYEHDQDREERMDSETAACKIGEW